MHGLIAIVGRPNVGKSALFNRIAGRRIAIVHDQPGVTRDRISAEAEWHGHPFTLVDTGGIGLVKREKAHDSILTAAMAQVDVAMESADVILLVVNVQEGVVPLDLEVATRLRGFGRPVLVAVNKADTAAGEEGVDEFLRLGFPSLFPVSAIHGRGLEALMKAALEFLPQPGPAEEPGKSREPLKLAVVGRPNVGKSSIINTLTGSARVIVDETPGTTRDSVDVPFEIDTEGVRQRYVLIDTAGMRKARRVHESVEFFSVKRAEESIRRADITLLVLDAEMGITEQDKKIGDRIVEARKACLIAVNKWDLMEEEIRAARKEEIQRRQDRSQPYAPKRMTTLMEFGEWVQKNLFFLDYAPVVFTSAKSGFHLDRLLEALRYVSSQLEQQIPTALLNRTLHDAVEKRQPVSDRGHRLKFFYATQVKQAPPSFVLFVNRDELFSPAYRKYLTGEMRRAFGYEGCPVVLLPRPRPKSVESRRSKSPRRRTGTRGTRKSRPNRS